MTELRFVDSISATPEVLFDVTDAFVLGSSSRFDPPRVRRSSSWTSLADGTTESSVSYDDREITLELSSGEQGSEEQAQYIQALARVLSDPQWLMLSRDGVVHPVFFRTRRADTRVIETLLGAVTFRTVSLTLPADPFAYGLPESGSLSIRNHPLEGTNRMCAVLEPAKGDVPSPLVLSFETPDSGAFRSVVAAWSPTDVVPTPAAIWCGPPIGDSVDRTPDADYVTGERVDVWPTLPANSIYFELEVPEPGDYRALLRCEPAADEDVFVTFGAPYGSQLGPIQLYREEATGGPEWFDLGVIRLPLGSIDAGDAFDLLPITNGERAWLSVLSGENFPLDGIMLVPVGQNASFGSQSTNSLTAYDSYFAAPVMLTLDGVNDVRYVEWAADVEWTSNNDRAWGVGDLTGGLPVVTPGRPTQLTLMPTVSLRDVYAYDPADPAAPSNVEPLADDIDATTVVAWKYFPRYLYMRGIE